MVTHLQENGCSARFVSAGSISYVLDITRPNVTSCVTMEIVTHNYYFWLTIILVSGYYNLANDDVV